MPTEVYEDSIDLEIGLIEAESLRPDGGEAHRRSYPYPVLHPAPDRAVSRTFPTVVLENAYLRATFIPALGGRLLRLFDKGLNIEIFPAPTRLMPESGGLRGAFLKAGIQVLTGPDERPDALAEAPHLLDPPSDEEPIGVWFFGLGGDSSFHSHWTLEPERAELHLEVRVLNRSFRPVAYNGGVCLDLLEGAVITMNGGWLWTGGLGVWEGETPLDAAAFENGRLLISRFRKSDGFRLGPRQVDSFQLSFTPTLPNALSATREVSVAFGEDLLVVRAIEQRTVAKVLLHIQSGQTLESSSDLWPEQPLDLSLGGMLSSVQAVAVQDSARNILLQCQLGTEPMAFQKWQRDLPVDVATARTQGENAPEFDTLASAGMIRPFEPSDLSFPKFGDLQELSGEALIRATSNPSLRAAAWVRLAMRSLAHADFAKAERQLETSLLFNAEDPLAWWLRAVALRKAGEESDDRPELLNAHFLAPLEPTLRAESFLSQPPQPGREPVAILKPIADQPEAFLEVACLLLDAGLMEDAQRWMDEALRHSDLSLLRYLLAHAYLESSRMHVEAAQQVTEAGKSPVGPPYPWRRAEVRAVRVLAQAFPEDSHLAQLVQLIDALTQ